jgi:hypothetical protein
MRRILGESRHEASVAIATNPDMPWVWVVAVLVCWTVAAFAVIALCVSVRRIDARLGFGRREVLDARKAEPRPNPEAKVE